MYNYTPLIYKGLSGISHGFDSHHPLFFMQFDKIRKFSGEPCNIWVLRYFFMPIYMRILHNKCAICILFLSRFCHDFVTKMGLLKSWPSSVFPLLSENRFTHCQDGSTLCLFLFVLHGMCVHGFHNIVRFPTT